MTPQSLVCKGVEGGGGGGGGGGRLPREQSDSPRMSTYIVLHVIWLTGCHSIMFCKIYTCCQGQPSMLRL